MTAANPELIHAEGEIIGLEENGTFVARMANGHTLTAFEGGKKQENAIQLLQGEKVLLEISPYDLSRGRIVAIPSVACRVQDRSIALKNGDGNGEAPEQGRESAEALRERSSDLTVASGEAIPSGGFVVPGLAG